MDPHILYTAMLLGVLVLVASMASVELALSIAIIEIALGVFAGNVLDLHTSEWLDFLAGFGSIVLTFLAGAEVDPDLMRAELKESALIGGVSFIVPFAATLGVTYFLIGWDLKASEIAAAAMSTTSLAVVYAVLVETGLTETEFGKLIMAATFFTDFGTAAALTILFIKPTIWMIPFVGVSIAIIVAMRVLEPWFFKRYGNRVIEPELKGAFAALLILMYFGAKAQSHAVLPAFLLGLALAKTFERHRVEQQRFRVVAFAFLTPFFFLKSGMNVSLSAVWANIGLLAVFLGVKLAGKFVGVYPLARRYVPERRNANYLTLLMSTGLTFGTISSLYGLQAGIINEAQFSVLVTVVVLTAIVPTAIAQRFFHPAVTTIGPPPEGSDRSEAATFPESAAGYSGKSTDPSEERAPET
ncbi:MAG: cation:proton antiporter [Actinomycetota bacterium]